MRELMRAARLRRLRRQRLAPGELHRHLRHRVRRRHPDDRRSGPGAARRAMPARSTSGSVSPRRRPEHPRRAADAPADRQPRRDRHPHRARRRRARASAPSPCTPRTTPRRCTSAAPTRRARCAGAGRPPTSTVEQIVARGARGRLRRRPSRLRLPQRERRLRARCAEAGLALRRAARRRCSSCSATRRARARWRERCGVPGAAGHAGADQRSTRRARSSRRSAPAARS